MLRVHSQSSCRLCLKEYSVLIDCIQMPDLLETVEKVFGFKISESDKCSQSICRDCSLKTTNFSFYRDTVLNNQDRIQKYQTLHDQLAMYTTAKEEQDDVIYISDSETQSQKIRKNVFRVKKSSNIYNITRRRKLMMRSLRVKLIKITEKHLEGFKVSNSNRKLLNLPAIHDNSKPKTIKALSTTGNVNSVQKAVVIKKVKKATIDDTLNKQNMLCKRLAVALESKDVKGQIPLNVPVPCATSASTSKSLEDSNHSEEVADSSNQISNNAKAILSQIAQIGKNIVIKCPTAPLSTQNVLIRKLSTNMNAKIPSAVSAITTSTTDPIQRTVSIIPVSSADNNPPMMISSLSDGQILKAISPEQMTPNTSTNASWTGSGSASSSNKPQTIITTIHSSPRLLAQPQQADPMKTFKVLSVQDINRKVPTPVHADSTTTRIATTINPQQSILQIRLSRDSTRFHVHLFNTLTNRIMSVSNMPPDMLMSIRTTLCHPHMKKQIKTALRNCSLSSYTVKLFEMLFTNWREVFEVPLVVESG